MTPEEFSKTISNIVVEKRCSYLEAIAEACSRAGVEYEKVKPLLTPVILEHLQGEAEDEHLIPRTAKLPL